MAEFEPTEEQAAIYAAAASHQNLIIEAGAGSGKTTTVRGVSELPAMLGKGMYYAYNRSVADEAGRSFPRHVLTNTGHGFAFRHVAQQYDWMPGRLRMARQFGKERARILNITSPERVSPLVMLAPTQIARIAMDTVDRFAQSKDTEIGWWHVPTFPGLEDRPSRLTLGSIIVPVANRAWKIILDPKGALGWNHDYYVKVAQLSGLVFGADYLMLDEAQDSNGVTIAIVKRQMEAGTQIIAVGDRNQQLYAWRGAVDAMGEFGGQRLFLSKSFRFGPAIADEANKFLDLLDADLRITGHDPVPSRIAPIEGTPDAILCRTNAEAMTQIMDLQDHGVRVAFVDGKNPGSQMKNLATACDDLRDRGFTSHPELTAFSSWGQVLDYVENDHGGSDLSTAVNLIEKHGTEAIVAAVHRLVPEQAANVTVTTAHKAKGREWDRVRIAGDFQAPKPDENGRRIPNREESMLAYVAVTRAKKVLDRGSLSWVDEVLAEKRASAAMRERIYVGAEDDPDVVIRFRPAAPKPQPGDMIGSRKVIELEDGTLATIQPLDLDTLDQHHPKALAMLVDAARTPVALDSNEPPEWQRKGLPGPDWTEEDVAAVRAAADARFVESLRVAQHGTDEEKAKMFGTPVPEEVQRRINAAGVSGLDMTEVVLAPKTGDGEGSLGETSVAEGVAGSIPAGNPSPSSPAEVSGQDEPVDPLIAETAPVSVKAPDPFEWGEDPKRPGSCGAKHKALMNTYCTLDPHGPDVLHACLGVRPWDDSKCSELGVAPAHA